MINLSDCILLGTITKLHGFRGQLIVRLNNISSDKIREMELVFIEIDGLPVPFFVTEFSEKDTGSLLIKLEDIDEKYTANALIDAKVYIKSLPENNISEQFPVASQLLGYEVIDKNIGLLGTLKKIIDIQQNPLFCIIKNNKEILLPASKEFILEINDSKKTIIVEAPAGIADL